MQNYKIYAVKILLSFFVVCIHVNPFANIAGEQYGSIVNSLFRSIFDFAVPGFFTISGYLFYRREICVDLMRSYDKRYIIKIIKICIFWFIFYLFAKDIANIFFEYNFSFFNFKKYMSSFASSPLRFILNGPYYHLWFLPSLLFSVLIFVVLYDFYPKFTFLFSILIYIVGVLGADGAVLFGLVRVPEHGVFMGPLLFVIGYEFRKLEVKNDMFFLFFFISIFLNCMNIYFNDEIKFVLWISFIFFSIGLLMLVSIPGQRENRFMFAVGSVSLGIYVLHPFIILLYGKFSQLFEFKFIPIFKVTLVYIVTILVCIFLKKFDCFKNYV